MYITSSSTLFVPSSLFPCHAVTSVLTVTSRSAQPVLTYNLLASVLVDFDVESVGHGGAGFAWPLRSALDQQLLHLPKQTQGSIASESDEESVHGKDHDHVEPIDHEVIRIVSARYSDTCLIALSMLAQCFAMPDTVCVSIGSTCKLKS